MKRSSSVLLLLVLLALGEHPDAVTGIPLEARQRFPRRDNFLAYNIHRTFTPRDINDLDINQAQKAMVDVQQTIAEVQRLLARDPTLPRLTRLDQLVAICNRKYISCFSGEKLRSYSKM